VGYPFMYFSICLFLLYKSLWSILLLTKMSPETNTPPLSGRRAFAWFLRLSWPSVSGGLSTRRLSAQSIWAVRFS
jgi:hypothetical protein